MSKHNLNKSFKELSEMGYFAKQNFWCCQNCAWAAMHEKQAKKAVFYHMQDNEDLKEKGMCYLSWSGNGEEIVSILNKNGIKTSWDGDENKRILIDIN